MNVLDAELEQISAYTKAHLELQRAHHWLYDLKFPKSGIPEYVVLGINPGEAEENWLIAPEPTEETSRYDFHDAVGHGRASVRWSRTCSYFLDGADYVMAELFFWSSKDTVQAKERFGSEIERSPHLSFCRDMNVRLMRSYPLRAVVSPGINNFKFCAELYNLTRAAPPMMSDGRRIVEYFHDGERPWLFTRHWSGAFGFNMVEREQVRSAIRSL